jgi:DNA mismatch repair protein MutS2
MGSELIFSSGLPLGPSQALSEQLLQQTAEAQAAGLTVQGVFDLRPALDAAGAGGLINAKQLEGIACSLEAGLQVLQSACVPPVGMSSASLAAETSQVPSGQQQQQQKGQNGQQGQGGGYQYPALAEVALSNAPGMLAVRQALQAIRSCIRWAATKPQHGSLFHAMPLASTYN